MGANRNQTGDPLPEPVTVVRPVPGSRPTVSARAARSLRAILPVVGSLQPHWVVDVAGLGPTSLSVAGVSAGAQEPGLVALTATLGGLTGRMTVDSTFAVRLVETALGLPNTFRSSRALGTAERGFLAGMVAAAFEPLRLGVRLGGSPRAEADAARIAFRLEAPCASGQLELELSGAATSAVGRRSDAWRTRAARLPVVVRVEIASTRIRAAALVRLATGDAVVFDGMRFDQFAGDTSWTCAVAVGESERGYAAKARVAAEGALTIEGRFISRQAAAFATREEITMDDSETTTTQVLAAVPIEVVAELGRLRLRGDEVLGLSPGAVLTFDGGRSLVSLRVGGELWAEGEIVDVEGELGVRVTRLLPR